MALAQADGAPVPEQPQPPAAPTAPEPPPAAPTPPPAAPAPSVEPAPPPAPTPPPNTPPASDAFPPPPSAPPVTKKPAPSAAQPPAAATPAPAPESPPSHEDKPRRKRASEGLFEPKKPGDDVHHHDDDEDKDKDDDQFKIGPVVGTGIPSVISFGGTLKLTRFLGAGVNIGLIPKVQLSYYGDATLSYQHYDIYGRLYPFGGGFFLSGGAGYATVDGTLASSTKVAAVPGIPISGTANYDGKGSVRTLMLTALIGYFYTTSIGFSFGVDAGAQIPIAPSQVEFSSTLKTSPPGADALPPVMDFKRQADQSVRDSLEKIGRTTLPTVNLRIGWIL